MERLRRIQQKIKEGALRELLREGRWVLGYIRRYRAVVAIHILLGVLSTLMSLGTSVASKYLIDAVTGYKAGLIGTAAAAMAGMLLLGILLRSVSSLVGARINATDLRAGAAMVIAALMAEGVSEIGGVSYILRGYEHFDDKLRALGAEIEHLKIPDGEY